MTTDHRKIKLGEIYECHLKSPRGRVKFRGRVHAVDKSGITLAVVKELGREIGRNNSLEVNYFRPGSAYRFESTVLRSQVGDEAASVTIALPKRVDRLERRELPRKPVKGTLEFRAAGGRGNLYSGKVRDVGEGGLSFSTMFGGLFAPGSKPVGQEIEMDVKLLAHELTGIKAVVRHAWPDPDLRHIVVVNTRFSDLDPRQRNLIGRLIGR